MTEELYYLENAPKWMETARAFVEDVNTTADVIMFFTSYGGMVECFQNLEKGSNYISFINMTASEQLAHFAEKKPAAINDLLKRCIKRIEDMCSTAPDKINAYNELIVRFGIYESEMSPETFNRINQNINDAITQLSNNAQIDFESLTGELVGAIKVAIDAGYISVELLRYKLNVEKDYAKYIINELEAMGIVGEATRSKDTLPRKVLIEQVPAEWKVDWFDDHPNFTDW